LTPRRKFATLLGDRGYVLHKLSLRHYLIMSALLAAFALLGEAVSALRHGEGLRPGDQSTMNALVFRR